MSGESASSFFRKPKSDPFQARFEVESDRRLFGCMGSGSTLGVMLAVYALSIQIFPNPMDPWITPGNPQPPIWPNNPGRDKVIRVRPPVDYHGSIRDRKLAHADEHGHRGPGQEGHQPAMPKALKPPRKDPGALGLALITSKGSPDALIAYDMIGESVHNVDLDKLENFGSLTRTDKTRLGGRMGRQGAEFNEAYYQDGTGDKDGGGVALPGLPGVGGIPGKAREPQGLGKPVEIDQFRNTTSRSTASILAVIRSHSPGLRHVYNGYLKQRPGLAGKITLRFAIAPSGEVVDAGLAGSTTGYAAFDEDVVGKVMSWRFELVKAPGNDIVTVPFNFSE